MTKAQKKTRRVTLESVKFSIRAKCPSNILPFGDAPFRVLPCGDVAALLEEIRRLRSLLGADAQKGAATRKSLVGCAKGMFEMRDDFNEPLVFADAKAIDPRRDEGTAGGGEGNCGVDGRQMA